MNVLIIHAHPEAKSFNGALTCNAKKFLTGAGHQVIVSDLYAMKWTAQSDRSNFRTTFDPDYYKQQMEEAYAHKHNGFSEAIRQEMEKLFWCEVLIFQFSMSWFGMPAILKAWVEKVLAYDAVYVDGKKYDNGMMKGKKAMVSMTVDGPESIYAKKGIVGDVDTLLFPIHRGIFSLTGFDVLPPFLTWQPSQFDDAARAKYLKAYEKRLATIEDTSPIYFPKLRDYDKMDMP